MSFAAMFANFIPGGKALTGIKKAVKKGSMIAMKAAMKKAVKDVAKKMLKKARKNLKKEMKARGKELKDEVKEAILQGGAEEIAEVFIAKTQTGFLKDTAVELLKAVDPTGIADVVGAFEADRCRDKVIEDFPECEDTSNGAVDPYGDGCAAYANHPSWCGGYDDADFTSNEMCCACDTA